MEVSHLSRSASEAPRDVPTVAARSGSAAHSQGRRCALKKSLALLLATLSFSVSLRAGALAISCFLPNCHAQAVAASSPDVGQCSHESSNAPLIDSKSGCDLALTCSCFNEQLAQVRAAHPIVLSSAGHFVLVQLSPWKYGELTFRGCSAVRSSHTPIAASPAPAILRI